MNRLCSAVTLIALGAVATPAVAAPIIGGTPTKVGDFPNVVAIFIGGDLCTGILVDHEWVVTAAHCLDPNIVMLADQTAITAATTVYFNNVDINKTPITGGIKAQETFYDTRYDADPTVHDVGLIHLVKPVTNIVPGRLEFDSTKVPIGIVVTMVGFGTTQTGNQDNATAGVEEVIGNQTAIDCSSQHLSNTNLLCFSQTNDQGKCEGDSGGPSFATINGLQTIVGLTSFGDQSCDVYGADTRPGADASFILSHVPNLECGGSADAACGSGETCFDSECIVSPNTANGVGTACTKASDCDSAACETSPSGDQVCVIACGPSVSGSCPDGFGCTATGSGSSAGGSCFPNADGGGGGSSGGGGCDAGNAGAPAMLLGIGLLGLVLRRRRA